MPEVKVTFERNGSEEFSMVIDVEYPGNLSDGVDKAMEEFRKRSPSISLINDDVIIKFAKI